MGDKEGGFDITTVGIFALSVENLSVEVNVVVIDSIVKSDGNHLRYILAVGTGGTHITEIAGDLSAIF